MKNPLAISKSPFGCIKPLFHYRLSAFENGIEQGNKDVS